MVVYGLSGHVDVYVFFILCEDGIKNVCVMPVWCICNLSERLGVIELVVTWTVYVVNDGCKKLCSSHV